MDSVECVVVGAGVIGLAVARAPAPAAAARSSCSSAATPSAARPARATARSSTPASTIRPAAGRRGCACAGRSGSIDYCQSRGVGHRRIGKLIVAAAASQVGDARGPAEQGDRQWRDRSGNGSSAAGASPRAGGALRRRPAVALDRHHRQPWPDAEPAGRSGRRGRRHRLPQPGRGRLDRERRLHARRGRADPGAIRLPLAGELPPASAPTPCAQRLVGFDWAFVPPLHLAKGNYFMLSGKSPFNRLIYPLPDARQPRRARHSRSGWAGPFRAGRPVDRHHRLRRRRPPGAAVLPPPSAVTTRTCATARSSPATPASGRNSSLPAARPRISVIQGPETHGIPAWSTSSASNRRG